MFFTGYRAERFLKPSVEDVSKMKSDTSPFSEKDQNIPCENVRRTISKGIGVEIFNSLQDPLILVTPEGIITEVNPALLQAAQKEYDDIIGRGICEIIHGGRWPHIECPLEEFLRTCTPRVEDTRLPGLGGEYSLSIIPVTPSKKGKQLILLIARLLTKEEIRKVESIRTAQLAAIGELAAGVAHEVNNPINGIINFAHSGLAPTSSALRVWEHTDPSDCTAAAAANWIR